jgi:hypothetical protein
VFLALPGGFGAGIGAPGRNLEHRRRPATVGAAVGSGALLTVSLFGLGGGRATELLDPLVIGIFAMTPIWLVVGATLQRLPPVVRMDGGPGDLSFEPEAA